MRSANGGGARRGLAPRARARLNRELAERVGGEPAAEEAEALPPGRAGLGGFLRRQEPRLGEIAWLASLGFLVGGLGLAVLSQLMLLDALRLLDLAWVPREPAILALGIALTVGIIGWLLLGLVVEAGPLAHLYRRRFTTSGNLGKLWIALAVAGGSLGRTHVDLLLAHQPRFGGALPGLAPAAGHRGSWCVPRGTGHRTDPVAGGAAGPGTHIKTPAPRPSGHLGCRNGSSVCLARQSLVGAHSRTSAF